MGHGGRHCKEGWDKAGDTVKRGGTGRGVRQGGGDCKEGWDREGDTVKRGGTGRKNIA